MRVCGWEFGEALDKLYQACDSIRYARACDDCPLEYKCIATNTFWTVAREVPFEEFEEMLNFAEDCRDTTDERDIEALYADRQRKAEAEERMIDAEYGYY